MIPYHKRPEAPERPITFRAAEDLGAFDRAQLRADRSAWPLGEQPADAALACRSALAVIESSTWPTYHGQAQLGVTCHIAPPGRSGPHT